VALKPGRSISEVRAIVVLVLLVSGILLLALVAQNAASNPTPHTAEREAPCRFKRQWARAGGV
jgi:hypothetical protein